MIKICFVVFKYIRIFNKSQVFPISQVSLDTGVSSGYGIRFIGKFYVENIFLDNFFERGELGASKVYDCANEEKTSLTLKIRKGGHFEL